MKFLFTRLGLALMAVTAVACSGKRNVGAVEQFQVFERTTLKSTDGSERTFEPGAQAPSEWKISFNAEKNPPEVALKNKRTGDLYEISSDFRADVQFIESRDASTPWQERWDACFREVVETVCDGRGACWTRVIRIPGNQRVRERVVGAYEVFDANVFNKSDVKAAYLRFAMDRTSWEQHVLSPCF